VQATDHRLCLDRTHLRRLDAPRPWTVLGESEVSSRTVVVGEVVPQNPKEMPFAEDDDVIQAFPPDRSDHLSMWQSGWRSR